MASQRVVTWQENADFGILGNMYWNGVPVAYHGGPTYFQQQDWLGTERVRTASNGNTVAAYFSLPFGDGFSDSTSSDVDPYHFALTEHDRETATDHAQFRQYREAPGRWLSPDPYDGSYDFTNPGVWQRFETKWAI